METFAGMEAFVTVVECGGFTAAATRLRTAKSSVSDTVRALEERLGVRLLERTTRRLRPTEAGRTFYLRCRRLLDEAKAAREEARLLQQSPVGTLRLAAPDSFAERFILPGLAGFLARYPSVDVDLVTAARFVNLVADGFDLAIRIDPAPDPGLVVRRIGTSRLVVVAAPAYLETHGAPATLQDLARHSCVCFSPLESRTEWTVGGETATVRPKLLVSAIEALRAAALGGVGITMIPDWMVVDALAGGTLVRLFADREPAGAGIYAVYPTARLLSPLIRLFVDHLAGEMRRHAMQE
jgi:DNA-binding transcriptional LysR family regulator